MRSTRICAPVLLRHLHPQALLTRIYTHNATFSSAAPSTTPMLYHIFVCVRVCVSVCSSIYVYIYVYMYACIYVYTHTHTHTHTNTNTHTHTLTHILMSAQHPNLSGAGADGKHASKPLSILRRDQPSEDTASVVSIRQHAPAHASTRQHTAYDILRRDQPSEDTASAASLPQKSSSHYFDVPPPLQVTCVCLVA
jgi:hypothetical protein